MEENQKKAFDFAVDLTKQLITLSTAIITLTVTFSKDILGGVDDSNKYLLLTSWIFFIISIFLGVLTLMALTGNLDPMAKKQPKNDDGIRPDPVKPEPILTITSNNVTSTARWQVWTFLFALVLTIWYGYCAVTTPDKLRDNEDSYMIIRESKLGANTTIYIY